MSNPELWKNTALFITYDEHDGFFDHQLPPFPEPTVTDEHIDGLPIGPGTRVPMLICSPWTRGGYVDSNVYDHTSMLQFLAAWTGVQAGQRHPVAGVGDRRPDRRVRLQAPGLLDPGQHPDPRPDLGADPADGRIDDAAGRGRPADAGPGARHPAAPSEPSTSRSPT